MTNIVRQKPNLLLHTINYIDSKLLRNPDIKNVAFLTKQLA